MSIQTILAVDDKGKLLGYIPKEHGHKELGQRHLAITILLYNSKDQVLLQKRKHSLFNNLWDFTGATHPLHKEGGANETLQEATKRCLKDEWGISRMKEVKEIGVFNYFAKDGEYCENEHCAMMIGEYKGEVSLDPKAGYEYKWMDKKEFLKDLENNPNQYTPWAKKGIEVLKEAKFF